MPDVEENDHARMMSVYITLEELAEWVGSPIGSLSVSHVDTAPNKGDSAAVRITLREDCTKLQDE
jgi:hypothetical protein